MQDLEKFFTPWVDIRRIDEYLDLLNVKDSEKKNWFDRGHWVESVQCRWHRGKMQERVCFGQMPADGGWWFWWINAPREDFHQQIRDYIHGKLTLMTWQCYEWPDGSVRYNSVWHRLMSPKDEISHPIPYPFPDKIPNEGD